MKKVITPMQITAADSNRRTITGRIVTFEETGSASIGKVQFASGSIEPTPVLLNLEHDRTRRIGSTLSMTSDDKGIEAVFKIVETTAGNDSLVEASTGMRDGFSVEVSFDEYETLKDGTVRILKGELTGVALTSEPAIRSARVESVAATTAEENEVSDSTIEPEEKPTTEGDEVDNTVTQAEAVETVEAAEITASARPKVGGFTTKPRIEVTAAKYLENTIRSSMGDLDARDYVHAANNGATTTDNAGLVPTRQLTEIINGLGNTIRPSIDAISRGTLPDAGMTFEIPRIDAMPTVAVTSETSAFSNTDQESSFLSVPVVKFAGQQKFSVELLERSSPLFFDELLRNMVAALAKAQNAYVNGILVANAGIDGTKLNALPTAAELLGFVSRGAATVYTNTQGFARNIIMGASQWANTMSLNDNGRPIYVASQPMNAGGALRPDSLRGNVAGLDLYADFSAPAGSDDGSLIVVNPDAYTWYESSNFQLRSESTADGSITVGLYSFGATAIKLANGAFRNDKNV
jgi:HK97 family phage major capsid protein